MKKIVLLSVFFVFFMLSALAYAHPPADIKITFDSETKMLNAVIFHQVSNPRTHYIKKVDVYLNDKEVIQQDFPAQDNINSQTVDFHIPDAKPGDVLYVEAYCSISGKLKKQLK